LGSRGMAPGGRGSERQRLVRGRTESLARRLRGTGGGDPDSNRFADAAGLAATIDVVTLYGAAITLARTSDGGAFSVTIIDNGEYSRNYPHTVEELEALLQAICEVYGAQDSPAK